jgi:hypothetical protein
VARPGWAVSHGCHQPDLEGVIHSVMGRRWQIPDAAMVESGISTAPRLHVSFCARCTTRFRHATRVQWVGEIGCHGGSGQVLCAVTPRFY